MMSEKKMSADSIISEFSEPIIKNPVEGVFTAELMGGMDGLKLAMGQF